MSSSASPSTTPPVKSSAAASAGSLLLQTIESDLRAGVSWLEGEAEQTGLILWNAIKTGFIALEPLVAQALLDGLTTAVQGALAGHTVEQIEQSALNTGTAEFKAAAASAGSGTVQTIIAGLRAQYLPGLGGKTSG